MIKLTLEKSVLTVACSDSCGGSGIQADMGAFAAFGVYGASVLTAVTARNTQDTRSIEPVSDRIIIDQMEAVLADLPIRAIKTGMLPSIAAIAVLGEMLRCRSPRIPLIVDPVVIEPPGREITQETTLEAVRSHLFPLAAVVTPNLQEAEALTGFTIADRADMDRAASELLQQGPAAVLLKGGTFIRGKIVDLLMTHEGARVFVHDRHAGQYFGTGCALSAALAAGLAIGRPLTDAVGDAIDYVQVCLRSSQPPEPGRLGLLGHHPQARCA